MRKKLMKTGAKTRKRNAILIAVVALVAMISVVVCSLDWNGLFPGAENGGVIDNPPSYAVAGETGDTEVGRVPGDYNPDRTGWTALNNSNFSSTFGNAPDGTTNKYYLTEDVTNYTGFQQSRVFKGVLDGNGHSIRVTGVGGSVGSMKVAGALVAALGRGNDSGTIKNLTLIYDTALSIPRNANDKDFAAVGLVVGILSNGTIENVKVKVDKDVTVTSNNEQSAGGIAGWVGNREASDWDHNYSYITNCAVEINATFKLTGSNWHWLGGCIGGSKQSGWSGNNRCTITNFLLTGSGALNSSGSYNRRIGGIMGGFRGVGSWIQVKGFVFDMYRAGGGFVTDSGTVEQALTFINDGGDDSQITTCYYLITSRVANTYESGWAGAHTKVGTINTTAESSSLTAVPTLSNTGELLMKLTLSESYYELYGYDGGTQVAYRSSENFQTVKLNLGAVETKITANAAAFKVKAIAPVSVNTTNPDAFVNALKNGAAIILNADVTLGAKAFEAGGNYRARIIGNNHSVTLTGVSASAQGDVNQGGLVKTLDGARIENLTVVYSGNITRSLGSSNRIYAGLIAGEVKGGTVLDNVRVRVRGGTVSAKNPNGEIATGGFFGQATGAVAMNACVLEIEAGQKLIGGGAGSNWTWTGGVFGTVANPSGQEITMNKIAVVGGGTIEGQANALDGDNGNNNKRVGGLIGGMFRDSAGNITVTDYVFANLVAGNNKSRIVCFDGGTNAITVTRMYYLESDYTDSSNQGNAAIGTVNVSNKTKILKNAYDNSGAEMSAAPVTADVNSDFSKLRLTVPLVEYDEAYVFSYQLKNSGNVVLSSATLDKNTPSYTLETPLSEEVELKIQLKRSRSVGLPEDANRYEHGYVDSGYAQRKGYGGNADWVEISENLNTSMLGDLSDGRNYWLSSDVTIGGFVSTHAFSGVLDGCGHTITINADGGANGRNGNLGGLFAELTGTIKNARIVVKTSVGRTSGVLRAGLLAGLADSGARIENVKVSLNRNYVVSITTGGTESISLGGLAGLAAGSDETPVRIGGATVELNGELKADGNWSWVGGIVGRVGVTQSDPNGSTAASIGTRKLVAKQVVFRGDSGNLNNVDKNGTGYTERTGGFAGSVGGYGTKGVSTLEVDGFIFGYYGKAAGNTIAKGACKDSAAAVARFSNVFEQTGIDPAFSAWNDAGFGANATVTNESVVNSAFIQSGHADISLGYTLALFDPQKINTEDGTVDAADALVVLSIFEDNEKLNELFVADIEILYGGESRTSTEAVALVNVFRLTPAEALGTIVVQIRSGSANDGNASIEGGLYNANEAVYTDGWLTDNGRVPAMYGIPKGATPIADNDQLGNWLQGKASDGTLLARDSAAYLYGYVTTNFPIAGNSAWTDYPLAAGRTLDGAGHTLTLHTGGGFGLRNNATGWMTGADAAANNAKLIGELIAVNDGTLKNFTLEAKDARAFTFAPAGGNNLIYSPIAAVNNGIIENVKIKISATLAVKGNGQGSPSIIFGGVAGVNRGTIRYCTVENNGVVDLDTGVANQKIAGGIAGVNDGGTIEYTISSGTGIYQIGNSTKWPLLGGILGLGKISANTPGNNSVETVQTGSSLKPAQGYFRYALHNFNGTFKTVSGFPSSARGIYGAIAGNLFPWSGVSVDAAHRAVGLYAAVKNGANNWSYSFLQLPSTNTTGATLAYTGLVGTTTSGANNSGSLMGGDFINVLTEDAGGQVANNNEHHFWWDYWGGSGELRYEVYESARVSSMTVTGDGITVNPDRGTAYIDNRNATSQNAVPGMSIQTRFYNDGTYASFLNSLKNRGNANGTGGGTPISTDNGIYSNGKTIIRGSGNFYLTRDISVDVSNKWDGDNVSGQSFSGTFDGNGHTITFIGTQNLNQSCTNFGLICDTGNGTIKNLKIAWNASFRRYAEGNGADSMYRTGLIGGGDFWGTIENVSFTNIKADATFDSVFSNTAGIVPQNHEHNQIGLFAARQGGGTIRNCYVDFGSNFNMRCISWAQGRGAVSFDIGLVAEQQGATMTNIYMTGTTRYDCYRRNNPSSGWHAGLLAGKQIGSNTISDIYMDNVTARLVEYVDATEQSGYTGHKGALRGQKNGTISNIFLIGQNSIYSGTGTGTDAYAAPNEGVSSGRFFGNSVNDMLLTLGAVGEVSTSVSNGTGGVDTSGDARNLFTSYGEYKKSTFEATYKFVTRYPELGYYLEELKSGGTALSTGDGQTTYSVPSIGTGSKFPTAATLGVRGKINLIEKKTDALGNTVAEIAASDAHTQIYNGSDKTAFEFRATFWGDGTAGTGSVAPLSWNAGGAVKSGRIPMYDGSGANLAYRVQIGTYDADFAFKNGAGYATIPIGAVQYGGAMDYTVTRAAIEVVSDTGGDAGQWKSQGLLTFRFTNVDAVDGAVDQLVYSTDGGVNWKNVLKCNNFADGSATATVGFESQKGGTTFLFRAYSGIYRVSEDSASVVVRVDKSYPNAAWEQGSQPLSTENTERILVADDVSVGNLTKADDVLTITGPEGQNLDYTLDRDFKTNGKILVFTPDAAAAKSGDYVFTVKDAMGYKTEIRERLDFTPPTMTATVTTVAHDGVTAVTDPETTVGLNLADNYSDAAGILQTLKVLVYAQGDRSAVLETLSVADGTIDATGFDAATGLGNVILKLPEKYHAGRVDFVFEAKDQAGNAARVDALSNVILDTREYTLQIEETKTETMPYLGGVSYRLNGASYAAASGADGILHIVKAHLFDTLTVVYQKKAGFTYDGFDVTLAGTVTANCPDGTDYVVGGTDGDRGDEVARRIAFRATEELKLSVSTQAQGAGALKNGSFSDTLSDYFATDEAGVVSGAIPNLLEPDARVLFWNAEAGDYTAVKAWTLRDFFDFELTDPNGNTARRVAVQYDTANRTVSFTADENGILTFVENPENPGYFIEGAYTLTLRLKTEKAGIYTVLEGATATFNVSSKSRREITIDYLGSADFVYDGTVKILNDDGTMNADAFGSWTFEFAPGAFDEEPESEADRANLEKLRAGTAKLNYTLYYNGQLRAQKIGGTVTGDFSIRDTGAYYLTVSIPITGADKFAGVTGTKEVVFTVAKKTVTVTADDQSVTYGDRIAPDAYKYHGLVAEDTTTGQTDGVVPGALRSGVLVSAPRLLTEYTLVRIVGGAVSAYQNGITLSGGIAKNYDFTLVSGDITILRRGIVLKIADATKTYGYADPGIEFWGLSASAESGGVTNRGFAYSDNYLSFTPSDFRREAGENAYVSASGAQIRYAITGVLANPNYQVAVEEGSFTIGRRALSFRINGDSGLVYEEGVKRTITAKIANGLTSDNLSVRVEYAENDDWTSIGTHQYRLIVAENGTENSDQLLRNYSYDQGWVDVVIGASILNVVVLPQILTYGEEPAQGAEHYVLEGIKAEDVDKVTVRLFIPLEYRTVGSYAGAIGAEVTFNGAVEYTPAIRKGNLTVLKKEVELHWSGSFNAVYTGKALDKSITAKVASATIDPLNVRLSYSSKEGNASTPVAAGSYGVTAALQGTNAENYVVRAEDRTRQFVVQKSEQRISVGNNHTYDPETSTYPTFETQYAYRKTYGTGGNTYVVWRARISYLDLLSVLVNTETGYKSTDTLVPSITVYSIESVDSFGVATNALQTFAPTDGTGYFELEAGTYNAKAALPESDNFTGNTYMFTFVVTEKNNRLGNTSQNGNKLDIKNITGSYTATSLGQEVRVTDSAKIGYVVGPNAVNRPVTIQNGSISRLMASTLSNEGHMYDDVMSDGLRGTHDGDWAYAYFNIAVSEEIRQLILQDKVEMKLSFTAANQKGGVKWWTDWWNHYWWQIYQDHGAWREDKINPTDLSYMVREISSPNDLTADPVNASMIGTNGAPYNIRNDMQKYGATEGLGSVGGGLKQVVNGQNLPYYFTMGASGREGPLSEQCEDTSCVEVKTMPQSFSGDSAETVSLGGVKSGAAFRVYFLSTTLGATRTDVQIRGTGEGAWDGNYVGNVRNSFVFENISVKFVEKNSSVSGDTAAPEVVASPQVDSLTGGVRYRFEVRDVGTGIDYSSVSAVVNGERLTPGNGLSLSSYETMGESDAPILKVARFETGFISGTPNLGTFAVKDYAGNAYSAIPSLNRDTASPTLSGVTLVDPNTGANVVADEKFWYNRRLRLSVEATDAGGISKWGIYTYDQNGRRQDLTTPEFSGNKITSQEACGTGLYYIYATDTAGNTTTVTFNLLVDDSAEDGIGDANLAILPDPNVSAGGGDMWLNGNVAIENSVNKYGPSFGRMYYTTAPAGTAEDEERFRNTYMTDASLQWFAMDAEVVNGKFVLSENITTATKKYYAFKYVAGAASAPGADDNKKAYYYLGLIQIDRDEPNIVAESFTYNVSDASDPSTWTEKAGISSGEWTNKTTVFELSGTVGLSKGSIEWTQDGVDAEDRNWMRQGEAGYDVYYFNYATNRYTQSYSDTECFKALEGGTIFEYKAYLVVRGPNIGNVYAFRFRNGANSVAVAPLNVSEDHSSNGFRVAIDTTAPEVSHINSSWQPNQTKSQIYINETESGVRSVKVLKQQTDADGNGVFADGRPVYEDEANARDAEFTNNRYYFTFGGVYYKITVTDVAGNVGAKEVKLKIDERNPDVSLDGGAAVYSSRYVAEGTPQDKEKLGEGVYAYTDADGRAFIEFHFTVKGGVSGYTFAYSTVGYSTIESDWIKPGGRYDVGELPDGEGGYTNSFVFRLEGDRAERYLFRFTSGAQKSVYFDFLSGTAEAYRSENADRYAYRVNIDATAASADAFEFNAGDAQWRPLGDYDDAAWITSTGSFPGVGIRFTASENTVNHASTGLGWVTWQEEGGAETEILPESGYYVFYLTGYKAYTVRVYDKAGNVSEYAVPPKKIDLVAPGITIGATVSDGSAYVSGQATKQSVRLTYSLVYGDSGIVSILLEHGGTATSYSEDALREGRLFDEDFIGTVKLTIRNGAGKTAVLEYDLCIDKTAPDAEIAGLPEAYTTEPVDVAIRPTDGTGSGVRSATLKYLGDSGEVTVDVTGGYTLTVRDWREYTLTVEDNAGNVKVKKFTAQVNATVPEEFSMTAAVGGAAYVSGQWSTAPVVLTFLTKFSSVGGVINYGLFEYRADGGEWQTLFRAEEYVSADDPNKFVYSLGGERDGRYEFRAVTSAGKPSADTAAIESLKIDTVSPVLSAEGRVGGAGGALFVPDTAKGYTWISSAVEVTFGYTLGISGGKLYVDYKANEGDAYVRTAIAENLLKGGADGALQFTVSEEGYYRFGLSSNADPSDAAAAAIDYGQIRVDALVPKISVASKQRTSGGLGNYTLATWTKENVLLVVESVVGKSYLDSKLLMSKGDAATEYAAVASYDPATAENLGDGTYRIVTTVEISENAALNYDFRVENGAGAFRDTEVRRSGGAVRIDKSAPKLTIESVRANDEDYAVWGENKWNSKGWINRNLTFTFLVRTYLSGGSLKYYYEGLAGYTTENVASYGSATSGTDENGVYSERRYTLTLAGENFAIDAALKFRVESGAGMTSNGEDEPSAEVVVKIDKTRPSVDENSVVKTPNVPVNAFTKEPVKILFRTLDPEVGRIASGVAWVEFGYMSGSVFVRIGEPLSADADGNYSVSVGDNDSYLIRVTDFAGNYSDRAVRENVDRVEPTIEIVTDYVAGSLSTAPISFSFGGSVYGVSGAKAQYRLGETGEWRDAADADAVFEFDELLFSGTLWFRLLSGSGIASAAKSIAVEQDLNDYVVTVSEEVVAEGSYAANVSYRKNGTASSTIPTMKKGEKLAVSIAEKAEYPLYKIFVNGEEISVAVSNGQFGFEITVGGDTEIRLKFREIVSVAFEADKTEQSIRMKGGVNAPVVEPFSIGRDNRPGFEYSVVYKRVKDAYGNPVADGESYVSAPQTLGVYDIKFTVTGEYTEYYSFSDSSGGAQLRVYYFDKIQTPNVAYYAIETAYDLAYIRYAVKDGVEFRQTRDLTVTASVASADGSDRTRGDWTVGDFPEGVYNGANFKITMSKQTGAGAPLFGAIGADATVKNIGFVAENPELTLAANGAWAPVALTLAGRVHNVYAAGSVRIAGENVSVGGLIGTIAAGGALSGSYAGLSVDLTGASGDGVRFGGAAVENGGTIEIVFSVGSATGTARFQSGNMLALTGNGVLTGAVTIASALYSGTDVLQSVYSGAGVTEVKYWDLNDRTKGYWDTPILAETVSPKADSVSLKDLIDRALNGLTFEVDENNARYVPVSSYEQLAMIDRYLWADFRQTADVDAGGKPLAIARNAPFTGSFNGNGYVIQNVTVGDADEVEQGYGLFGNVTGTVENVVLKELRFDARAIGAEEAVVGGLVRNLVGGAVRNVSVGGTIVAGVPGGTLTVGGAVGKASGGAVIERVLSTVSVTTDGATKLLYAGSVVGAVESSSVRNVYSIAKVDANYVKRAAVGQLIGTIGGENATAESGYAVMGVTYRNGQGVDSVIGYDAEGCASADRFGFITFDEIMDAARHPDYTVNGKHVSVTLKTLFPFENGTGVQSDPFEIRTAEEFLLIGNYLYAHFNVVNDLEFDGNFETIGRGMNFTGSIKGVNRDQDSVKKLIGVTDSLVDKNHGTIQSLDIQSNVVKTVRENTVFGAVANVNYGAISFVKVNGTLVLEGLGAAGLTVGGVAGRNEGAINYSTANFTGRFGAAELRFGGIAGAAVGGELNKNVSQGSVSATVLGGSVGMLAGELSPQTVVTRVTDSAGAFLDVFLTLTVNGAKIPPDRLSGFLV